MSRMEHPLTKAKFGLQLMNIKEFIDIFRKRLNLLFQQVRWEINHIISFNDYKSIEKYLLTLDECSQRKIG